MTIQTACAGKALRSAAMVGSATLAMVVSSTDRLMPVITVAAAQYRRGVGRPSGGAGLAPPPGAGSCSGLTIS
ncbi:hypothetical protein D3C71_1044700 [compost metagenome]